MPPAPRRAGITSRVIRPGDPVPEDPDWLDATPDERVEAVWQLTLLCLAWQRGQSSEPRLQRSVVRVQRGRR